MLLSKLIEISEETLREMGDAEVFTLDAITGKDHAVVSLEWDPLREDYVIMDEI